VERSSLFFFFQAEDGIRDVAVTGVQTCALPISRDAVWLMALAIAAGACKKGKAGGPDPAGGGGGAPMGMPVEVVVARTDTVRDEISATGQIEAVQALDLRPEGGGRIGEVVVREGREGGQGTPLFQ